MRAFNKAVRAALGLSVALLGSTAMADTLTGTYVTYSFDSAELGLFGAAALSGDDLVFTPAPAFKAVSVDGSTGFASQTLHVTVTANTGYLLSAFSLVESGSYSLLGGNAYVGGSLSALDIEGTTDNTVFGSLVASGLGVNGVTTGWTGNAAISLPETGWGGVDGVVTSVKLTISNQLFATSELGSAAEIWKSAVGLYVVTSPVPEAHSYAMMLAGLGLVGWMARRRSRASV
jgi:hypothetical protein